VKTNRGTKMKTGSKDFLNHMTEETGYISWNVTDEADWCKKTTDLESNLTIADCRKSIKFDFNVYEDVTLQQTILKIQKMQDMLQSFKLELMKVYDDYK